MDSVTKPNTTSFVSNLSQYLCLKAIAPGGRRLEEASESSIVPEAAARSICTNDRSIASNSKPAPKERVQLYIPVIYSRTLLWTATLRLVWGLTFNFAAADQLSNNPLSSPLPPSFHPSHLLSPFLPSPYRTFFHSLASF